MSTARYIRNPRRAIRRLTCKTLGRSVIRLKADPTIALPIRNKRSFSLAWVHFQSDPEAPIPERNDWNQRRATRARPADSVSELANISENFYLSNAMYTPVYTQLLKILTQILKRCPPLLTAEGSECMGCWPVTLKISFVACQCGP